MRIVIGPHKGILAEILHQTPARRIAEKGCVYLLRNILAGQLLHVWQRHFWAMAYIIFVPFMHEERNPADFVLNVYELEFRESRHNAAENEIEECVSSIGKLGVDGGFKDVEALALKATVVEPRQNM